MDTKNGEQQQQQLSETDYFCLPTEFPYELDSNDYDEEDQLTELTRQLSLREHSHYKANVEMKSRWVIAGSPQSTLMGNWVRQSPGSSNGGSPNGSSQVSSPPTTPLGTNRNSFDVIHQAAGQVAKLKMTGDHTFYDTYVRQVGHEQMLMQQQQQPNSVMWCNGRVKNGLIRETPPPPPPPQQPNMVQNGRFGALMESENCRRRAQAEAAAAWRYVQQKNQQRRSVSRAASVFRGCGSGNVGGVKRRCAGTGVFLPRSYANNNNNDNNHPAEFCKNKPNGGSSVVLPAQVVHALNRNFSDMNGGLVVQPQHQPHLDGGYIADYEMLMARRNALLMQQRRNLLSQVNHGISLPQEWTY